MNKGQIPHIHKPVMAGKNRQVSESEAHCFNPPWKHGTASWPFFSLQAA